MTSKISYFKILIKFSFLTSAFYINAQPTPYIISFFIRPIEKGPTKEITQQKLKKSTLNHKTTKALLKKHFAVKHPTSGVFASYWGYLAISDANGQIIFPEKQIGSSIKLLITEGINPVPLSLGLPNLVRGFVVDPKLNSEYYVLTQNSNTNMIDWRIERSNMPSRLISHDTIIIFADPKNIIVPSRSKTIKSENLILPDLYATKNLNVTYEILRLFKIKNFFTPIKKKYNFQTNSYQERILY
jgi:hypothetical protein